jgi:hypothetical protein
MGANLIWRLYRNRNYHPAMISSHDLPSKKIVDMGDQGDSDDVRRKDLAQFVEEIGGGGRTRTYDLRIMRPSL